MLASAAAEEQNFHGRALTRAVGPASAPALQSSGNSNACRRPRRQRDRIDLDDAGAQPHAMGRKLFCERRRRASVGEAVLVAVPGAGDEAVDDAALTERPVLVRAEIGQRTDLIAVAKN